MDNVFALNLNILLQVLTLTVCVYTLVSFVIYLANGQKRYLSLVYLWLGYIAHLVLAATVASPDLRLVSLGLLSWFWRLWVHRLLLQDIAGVSLKTRWHLPLFLLGLTCMVSLMYAGQSFLVYTYPMVIGISIIGCHQIYRTWRALPKERRTIMHNILFVTLVLNYIHALDYPILRPMPDMGVAGYYITLVLNLVIGAVLPGLVVHDIQEAHKNELAKLVEERSEQLRVQAPSYAVGSLASGVAHEINNPLGIITAWVGALTRILKDSTPTKEELLYGLEKIQSNSFRIARIVRALRDFSDMEKHDEPPAPVTLDGVVEDALTFCRERFQTQHVELRLRLMSGVVVEARAVELSQALLYVLLNACDAVRELPEKWVELKMEKANGRIRFIVTDSGSGIPTEVAERMMDPFFSTKPVGEGAGMGLTMARGILETHRGSLSFIPANHTTFILELPTIES